MFLGSRTRPVRGADNLTEAQGFTQPLTQMSTGNKQIMFPGTKVRPVRGADNLTGIYEPNV
jgi:hypothetical protein